MGLPLILVRQNLKKRAGHLYHLVNESPWPLLASISGLGLTRGLVEIFTKNNYILISLSSLLLAIIMWQ